MTKKEKLLASAQKSLQKGQISKAIKDYQNLVELDPKDLRNRQKLAELYNRSKMTAQAIEEFENVGKYYTDNGFFLKAIAVYKQVQRIDPHRLEVYKKLAELNEKQGLIGNAMAEYKSLVAYHEKAGDTDGSIKVLQKMRDLDPENLNIRVKIAETFAKEGRKEEALEDFQDVLKVLKAKKDNLKILKLHEIFVGFFPDDLALKIGLGQALVAKGDGEKAVSVLEPLLDANDDHEGILRALAGAYRKQGDHGREEELYTRLVAIYPGDLDLRELQVQACLDGGDYEQSLKLLEESKGMFFEANRVPKLREYYEGLRERLPGEDRIIATLHSIYEVSGDGGKLFDILSASPSDAAAVDDDAEETTTLEAEVDELVLCENPFQAEDEPEPVESDVAEPDGEPEPEIEAPEEMPLEFLMDVEEDLTAPAADTPAAPERELSLELDVDDAFGDLDFDVPDEEEEAEDAPAETLELDDGELSFSFDEEEEESSADEQVDVVAVVDLTAQIEEAGFYLTQGLYDEAEKACSGILEAHPDCREAEELLVDIRAQREPAAETPVGAEDDFFNFSDEVMAEVDAVLDVPAPPVEKKSRYGMEGEFSQFKKGVEAQVDSNDAETHYNLGIAYREMGLIDDAIGEFDHAMRDPARRVDCLTLKGICLLDKNKFDEAEGAFKAGLSTSGLAESQKCSLCYELGLLYENWDRPLDALESFQTAADVDPFFRNVQEKIQELRHQLGMEEGDGNDSTSGSGGKNRVSYV